jgi:hypothetical protein
MMAHRIFQMSFASIYPLYVAKVEKKGRTQDELNEVICWLTGYSLPKLLQTIEDKISMETFFAQAQLNQNASLITGKICGVTVEAIEDPLMQKIRYMDKLVDELAKGRSMDKICRC